MKDLKEITQKIVEIEKRLENVEKKQKEEGKIDYVR
jgi:hypothetical protein